MLLRQSFLSDLRPLQLYEDDYYNKFDNYYLFSQLFFSQISFGFIRLLLSTSSFFIIQILFQIDLNFLIKRCQVLFSPFQIFFTYIYFHETFIKIYYLFLKVYFRFYFQSKIFNFTVISSRLLYFSFLFRLILFYPLFSDVQCLLVYFFLFIFLFFAIKVYCTPV